MTGADGIVMTGADGIVMTGADAVRAIGADGAVFSVVPDGFTFAGVTGIVMTGADGIVMTGADGIVMTGADGIVMTGADDVLTGLQSVDPELAVLLNRITDDSGINAVVVYHDLPTESDLGRLTKHRHSWWHSFSRAADGKHNRDSESDYCHFTLTGRSFDLRKSDA